MSAYWVSSDKTAQEQWVADAAAFLQLPEGEIYGIPEQKPDGSSIWRVCLSVNVGGVFAADYVPLPTGASVAWIRPDDAMWQPAGPPIPPPG